LSSPGAPPGQFRYDRAMRRARVAASFCALFLSAACASPPNEAVTPAPIVAPVAAPPPNADAPKVSDVTGSSAKPGERSDSPSPPDALPSKNDLLGPRDGRMGRTRPRGRALLVTELNGLESLFATVPPKAPDRPTLIRRLAEDYAELEAACVNDSRAAEATAARHKSIANYSLLRSDHPSYPLMDEALYYLAYEYELDQDLMDARKTYFELIQKHPSSRYIPNAYLAFGEMFFEEAAKDPSKWDLAIAAYNEVIKYPPPDNKVYGYAWYKRGWANTSKGEYDQALNSFKKTIDYCMQYSQISGNARLADAARKDIVFAYVQKGSPTAAYNFFRTISGDTPPDNDRTFKMMDDLGQSYIDTGHYPDAIAVYKDLSTRDSTHNCKWGTQIQVAAHAALARGQTTTPPALAPCP
jgi:tetratricopeptide (TPR) repeat protein